MYVAFLLAVSLASLFGFILAHWAIASSLALFLLANFITAATAHPDVVPDSALKYVKFAAQFLSLLTHSGSPDTFKAPFSVQAAPLALVEKRPSSGYTRVPVLAFLVVACILASACASVFGPKIVTDLEACGAKVTKDVEAQVAATLLAGGATWQADLFRLAAVIGNDGLICAINVAIADFEATHAAEPASAPPTSGLTVTTEDAHTAAIARGKAALASLGASPH